MILKTMIQPNRTLYRGAGIYIMNGYDFYYEAKTKVNVFSTRTKANKKPQAKCPPTCEMSVCGEYVYSMFVKKMPSQEMANSLPSPLSNPLP